MLYYDHFSLKLKDVELYQLSAENFLGKNFKNKKYPLGEGQ